MDSKDRSKYLRVTDILSPFTGIDKINPDILKACQDRGTLVHSECEGIIKGFERSNISPYVSGYVESFKKWWGDGMEVLTIEERFYNDELQITGQVDLIIKDSEKRIILVDLKTSAKPQKSWPLQLAAYGMLASQKFPIEKALIVRLNKDGSHPEVIDNWCHMTGWPAFVACCQVYRYFYSPKKEPLNLEDI